MNQMHQQTPQGRGWLGFQAFVQTEAASGFVLLAAAVVALLVVNLGAAEWWFGLWAWQPLGGVAPNIATLPEAMKDWVKDGLMCLFFFVVGLELKRERVRGHLRDTRVALLPLLAAVGGVVMPALVFWSVTQGAPADVLRGWAVPCATDIAFAMGVVALLGNRVPPQVRTLLLTLAVADDLGAMLLIAVFYSSGVDLEPLLLALGFGLLFAGSVRQRWCLGGAGLLVPVLLAMAVWLSLLPSGLHPSIGAVALALSVPSRNVLEHWEQGLHPWVAFGVMPMFALASAGVPLAAVLANVGNNPATLPVIMGVSLGLLVGKPLGIVLAVWLAEKFGFARRPAGMDWGQVLGVGMLAGIGFTMSMFVAKLAYDQSHLDLQHAATLGVLLGSLLAGVLGWVTFRLRKPAAG
jgi:Na+:H+ antiporter, NhaA family